MKSSELPTGWRDWPVVHDGSQFSLLDKGLKEWTEVFGQDLEYWYGTWWVFSVLVDGRRIVECRGNGGSSAWIEP